MLDFMTTIAGWLARRPMGSRAVILALAAQLADSREREGALLERLKTYQAVADGRMGLRLAPDVTRSAGRRRA